MPTKPKINNDDEGEPIMKGYAYLDDIFTPNDDSRIILEAGLSSLMPDMPERRGRGDESSNCESRGGGSEGILSWLLENQHQLRLDRIEYEMIEAIAYERAEAVKTRGKILRERMTKVQAKSIRADIEDGEDAIEEQRVKRKAERLIEVFEKAEEAKQTIGKKSWPKALKKRLVTLIEVERDLASVSISSTKKKRK